VSEILLVVLAAIIGPVILNWLTGRRSDRNRKEDWARQDRVAEKAAIAVALNDTKLNQIHTLVNSEMTDARQEILNQTVLLLGMYRKTIQADNKAGRPSLPEDLAAVTSAETKVRELRILLADRLRQQHIADQEMSDDEQSDSA